MKHRIRCKWKVVLLIGRTLAALIRGLPILQNSYRTTGRIRFVVIGENRINFARADLGS